MDSSENNNKFTLRQEDDIFGEDVKTEVETWAKVQHDTNGIKIKRPEGHPRDQKFVYTSDVLSNEYDDLYASGEYRPVYNPLPSVRNGFFQQIFWTGVAGFVIVNHYDREIVLVDTWPSYCSNWLDVIPTAHSRPLEDADQVSIDRLQDFVNFLRESYDDGYTLSCILLSHMHFDHTEDIPAILELLTWENGTYPFATFFNVDEQKLWRCDRKITLKGKKYTPDDLPTIVADFDTIVYLKTQYYGVECNALITKEHGGEASSYFLNYKYGRKLSVRKGRVWEDKSKGPEPTLDQMGFWYKKDDQLHRQKEVWLNNKNTKERYSGEAPWHEITINGGDPVFYDAAFNTKHKELTGRECPKPGQKLDIVDLKQSSFEIQPYLWDHMNLTAFWKHNNDINGVQAAGSFQRTSAFLITRRREHKGILMHGNKRTFFVGSSGEFAEEHTKPVPDKKMETPVEADMFFQAAMGNHLSPDLLSWVPDWHLDDIQDECRKYYLRNVKIHDYLIFSHWDEFVRWITKTNDEMEIRRPRIMFKDAYYDNINNLKKHIKNPDSDILEENRTLLTRNKLLHLGRVGSISNKEFEILMPVDADAALKSMNLSDGMSSPFAKPVTGNMTDDIDGTDIERFFVDYLPITKKNDITLYRDGDSYCNDLYTDITKANSEICLTGLHFSGNFRLKRPGSEGDTLQEVLARASREKNVKIYLLVNLFWCNEDKVVKDYEEARRDLDKYIWKIGNCISGVILEGGGLANYLKYTCQLFSYLKKHGKPENIFAYADRHRGYIMHSNHQKTIIIDRKTAYLGGIDLTDIDGDRWDTSVHDPVDERRKYNKPERNWHDLHMRVTKNVGLADSNHEPGNDTTCAVDFVYANFLARYNYGCLYSVSTDTIFSDPESMDIDHVSLSSVEYSDENGSDDSDGDSKSKEKVERLPGDCQAYINAEAGTRCIYPDKKIKPDEDCPLVQIVRSMPTGSWWTNYAANQHPEWNKGKTTTFEKSARESYIKGIKAAEKFIYLENQWVCDEDIWEALLEKAEEKKDDKDFRITLVIPKKFLESAGMGRDQDMNLEKEVKRVYEVLGERFGIFSILQSAGAKETPHYKIPECSWEYVYIHSKLMIVDDVWMIIGSANAGGISLTGLGAFEEPDTELSAVIYDDRKDSIVTGFRKDLLAEHLEENIDIFSECHDAMHEQAKGHSYESTSAKKVHYNVLFNPHRKIKDPGVWQNLNWKTIYRQINMRIKDPDKINQTYYNLSGPLTVLHMLASTDIPRYTEFTKNIFFTGKSAIGDIDVKGEDLCTMTINSQHPILEIDWMLASSMIDSENWFFDFQGSTSETFASKCSDSDMIEFMENVIPCENGVDHLSCEVYGELKEGKRASKALLNPDVVVAVKVGIEMFFEENETAIEKDEDEKWFDRGDPKYWINHMDKDLHESGPNPFCSPLRHDAQSGYPGVLTTYGVKYNLPDKMFVRLMKPLEFHLNSSNDVESVTMTFWTWGKVSTLTMPLKRYEKNVYGFFVGYRTKNAAKPDSNKPSHKSDSLDLPTGSSHEYLHEDVDETTLTVKCLEGKMRVSIETRIWWDWNQHSSYELSAGQNIENKQIGEQSNVCDQDCRVTVTALTGCKYTIDMNSEDK